VTTLLAPAKLTWTLEVTRRRADGYHELRSEMTTLELADLLEVDEAGEGIEVVGLAAALVAAGPENLVARALALVGRRAGVIVTKSIPVGGGLGGGSADAAAILRWAGVVDPAAALGLGSDVPFCLVGGRALVEGVGERVTPLPYERREVTLFLPSFAVETAAVYRAYDELVATGWRPSGANHLEEPARRVEPRLGELIDALRAELGDQVTLAGSGSTLFVPGWPLGPAPSELAGARVLATVTSPAAASGS
jgi:4-diphosphocytidyl-2-C-methyl-D-erythritol kinase